MSASGPSMLKRLRRFQKAQLIFPDRAEFYQEEINKLEMGLKEIKACMRCGRPLKGEDSQARGYGPECAKKQDKEEFLEEGEDPHYVE